MKPCTWEEIKSFLEKDLKKTKHILTFGTIGSLNLDRDIDIIITKKPSSKIIDFFKEVHELFFSLDKNLKKYNAKAIRFWGLETELKELSQKNKNDIIFQVMMYSSYPQMKKDWDWVLEKDHSLKNILKDFKCLLGNKEQLLTREFSSENYSDPAFLFLVMYDRINSHYPDKLFLKVMNEYHDFLLRKKLGFKPKKANNKKEAIDIFYEICTRLDKLNTKK